MTFRLETVCLSYSWWIFQGKEHFPSEDSLYCPDTMWGSQLGIRDLSPENKIAFIQEFRSNEYFYQLFHKREKYFKCLFLAPYMNNRNKMTWVLNVKQFV